VDDFPAGVWLIYYDWDWHGNENSWEKTSEGVAYLTNVADNLYLPNENLVIRETSMIHHIQRLLRLDSDGGLSSQWIILFSIGLLLSGIWVLLGAGKDFLAPHLGRVLQHIIGQSYA